jgi:uncharacterized membrane protein (UPF0127 family)
MGRESLPESAGMVFLEREPVRQSFWMTNTLIPLSVAFWDDGEEILAILDMEPCRADPAPTHDPAWPGRAHRMSIRASSADRGVGVDDAVTLDREG